MELVSDIRVVALKQSELSKLEKIGRTTFFETFKATNTAENLYQYLDLKFNPEQLQKEFEHPESEFYLARDREKEVGYLKINTGNAQTENVLNEALEVERIYVLKSYHGKNVGKVLLEKAIERARHKKMNEIWLGVWEHNFRAIRFYEKNDFKKFDTHIFKLGASKQTDFLMKRKATI